MKRFSKQLLVFSLVLICGIASRAQESNNAALSKAQDLLKQARAAIGGETRLNAVTGLAITGKSQTFGPGGEASRDLKLSIQMLQSNHAADHQTTNEDAEILIHKGAGDGNSLYLNSESGENGQQQKRIIKFKTDGPPDQIHAHMIPPEVGQIMHAWLLKPMPGMELSYAGDSQDGRADVIEIKNHANAKLYLDKVSHLPIMLSYQASELPTVIIKREEHDGQQIEIRKVLPDAQANSSTPAQLVQMQFSDHQMVDGLMLPHHVTKIVDGQIQEEWTIENIVVNPPNANQ